MQCTGTRTRATHTAALTHGSTYAWMPTYTHLHAHIYMHTSTCKKKGEEEEAEREGKEGKQTSNQLVRKGG